MAVTYDANYADYNVDYLANRVVATYSKDVLLADLAVNSSQFVGASGAYRPGASILINSVDNATTSYVTDVTTNSALSSTKASTTQYTLDLDTVAVTQFDYDIIEKAFANNWQPAIDKIISKYAGDHMASTESRLWSDVFNISGLTELGATGADADMDFDDLATINQKFMEADVPQSSRKYVVLPPDKYTQLVKAASSELELMEESLITRQAVLATKYNLIIMSSNNTPTLATMTNYTAGSLTTTNKVGFAFSDDAVALFNPDLTLGEAGVGIRENVIKTNGFSSTLSVSANNDLNVPEARYVMRSLFGGVIYRPTAVFPIKNGNIS